ncbi:MAG: hypothetical protein ACD_32C00014G0009 [uncultured bacterium]|uniref:Glycosyltransferase RgtA/B/C/D-like domain-containing protein n=1 Tax=Candidatus Daviesbacteria bacterium GW2011_GWC2_40_12 TaxID=1618431 RepID=A0A0G0QQJ7_9BACT|nr:MAG: hypothetical protein ACD_32C00014G0009 [uncultured bacterium]KKQ83997.1 MAG: hypothetical protein UT04_C0021G0013 [Candidatus Daviesbacteria bacterium GW2011_GWF2_38_7]KKR17327.1 MAG: hypothetical protein UT45_C0001G0002 [Candidatus Daviesbacteria bacterium GW2011_GWA2_39_33]KKR42704.1 MAG: hypothetical protein UT77_C0001G0155 [Candidatus Daviesbacteria bacterium GW2011_GWC2_40_12]OGE21377.1 MAG: hypothetical protein A2778_04385 [Candidatus Daviesbacteria bacterium RIFCSPHIGHO2_01_FULL_
MSIFNSKRITIISGIFIALLYLLLIFKDPFSQRTLIPNFEPHPDTFHYINPALNFTKREGFVIGREGRVIKPSVPPFYSISLIPVFLIKSDPRMSYYSNTVLALVSLLFFWLILKRIFVNKLILYLLLILYITNYFIYWVPTLVMAENLTLTLYLAAIFFLLSKTTKVNNLLMAVLVVGLYATKYANIATSISLIFLFFGKVFFGNLTTNQKIKQMFSNLIFLIVFFLALGIFEGFTQGNNIFSQILGHLDSIYKSVPKSDIPLSKTAVTSSWFGVGYIRDNLPLYINSLLGMPNKFLWDNTPIIPKFIGITGVIGIFASITRKNFSMFSLALFLSVFSSVIFMSTFYSFDARYIYIAIPALIFGFGLFLTSVENRISMEKKFIFKSLIFLFLIFYLVTNFVRIKSQISLNLKYAETPWYYISILKSNEYFTKDTVINGKKPILISALPPYLVDYYTNGNYTLLPLSYGQEFRDLELRQLVWGPNDYSNLPKLYKKYLSEGYSVYVSRAGLGNEGYTNRDFNKIVEEFNTDLVLSGCFDQCNIYSVKLKEKDGQ